MNSPKIDKKHEFDETKTCSTEYEFKYKPFKMQQFKTIVTTNKQLSQIKIT